MIQESLENERATTIANYEQELSSARAEIVFLKESLEN